MFCRTSLILASLFSLAHAETETCSLSFVGDPTCLLKSGSTCSGSWPFTAEDCDDADDVEVKISVQISNTGNDNQQVKSITLSGSSTTGASSAAIPKGTKTYTFTAFVDACGGDLQVEVVLGPPGQSGRRFLQDEFCPAVAAGGTVGVGPNGSGGGGGETSTPPTNTDPAPTTTGGPEGGSGEQGGGKRRRRLSAAANLVTPQDQVYQAHLDKCGEHEYDVSIYVDPAPHMYAILEPKSATQCPHGATHSIHYADGSYNKEILTFDTKADYQEMFEQEAFPIGTFTLGELEQAFQKIDVNSNHAYNVVENNCGMYLAKLGSELGVKVDHKMVSFVTRRLVEYSSKDLMDSIRKSAGALFQGRGLRAAVTDKDIVELLVQDSAADVLA